MMYFNNGMITASITSWITDKLVEWFGGGIWIELAAEIWNATLSVVYAMLGANPTSGTYAEAWNIVKNLYITFSSVGSSLLVLFFLIGYCRDVTDLRTEMTLDGTIKIFIRLVITINVFNSAIDWMPKLFGWAINLLGLTSETSVTINAQDIIDQVTGSGWGFMTLFLLGFLFFLVAAVCCVIVILTCIGRFLKLYVITPLATIAVSTLAGGGQIAQTGYAYIKTFLAYTFEIVVIGIALAVSGSFVSASSFFDSGSNSSLLIMIEAMIKMIAVTTAVKGSETALRKALNL